MFSVYTFGVEYWACLLQKGVMVVASRVSFEKKNIGAVTTNEKPGLDSFSPRVGPNGWTRNSERTRGYKTGHTGYLELVEL